MTIQSRHNPPRHNPPRHNKVEPIVEDKHLRPYGTRTLDPAIRLVDRAKEIEQAAGFIQAHTEGKLGLIAKQIRQLQEEARSILEEARRDVDLHQVKCNFEKVVGQTYHLYQKAGGARYFSFLSESDWRGNPPDTYIGSYEMMADRSFRDLSEEVS